MVDKRKFLPTIKDRSPMPKKPGHPKERYVQLEKLGEGAFGEVFKCYDETKKEIVAMKKIKLENEEEGFPSTTLREIAILQKMKHPNLVE